MDTHRWERNAITFSPSYGKSTRNHTPEQALTAFQMEFDSVKSNWEGGELNKYHYRCEPVETWETKSRIIRKRKRIFCVPRTDLFYSIVIAVTLTDVHTPHPCSALLSSLSLHRIKTNVKKQEQGRVAPPKVLCFLLSFLHAVLTTVRRISSSFPLSS